MKSRAEPRGYLFVRQTKSLTRVIIKVADTATSEVARPSWKVHAGKSFL